MIEEDKEPMESNHNNLRYRINYHSTNEIINNEYKENIVKGFLPLYIHPTKISQLLKSQKDKQLDKSYIKLNPLLAK